MIVIVKLLFKNIGVIGSTKFTIYEISDWPVCPVVRDPDC